MAQETLEGVIELVKKSNKIIVFTGAGISTNCGIPDFRGENGLYSIVQSRYNLPYPEAIFEIDYFAENPEPFFNLSRDLFLEVPAPSKAHEFVAWLEEMDKISLVVTQNVDMLHHRAGSIKVLECHGTYRTAHCMICDRLYNIEDIEHEMREGMVPYCDCGSVIKPDVVFFGEQLPGQFYEMYKKPPEADLLMVMGSSLNVYPAAGFALELTQHMPSIIINLEPTQYDDIVTYSIHEDLDVFCEEIWSELT